MADKTAFKPKQEEVFELAVPGKTAEDYKNRDIKELNVSQEVFKDAPSTRREDILDFGDEGFLLYDLLSEGECQHVIDLGEELGFDEIQGARRDYRNCGRIMVYSPKLAEVLYQHAGPWLREVVIDGDPHDVHIHGVESLLQGTWKAASLNPVFRLCRYYPGGHFAPHFDGHYIASSTERSMKTFMVYLNGGFKGGTTNFVDESQQLYMDEMGKYCAEEKNVLHRIKPERGMTICFNHHRLHEGEALGDGVKYILRTDVMFQKVDGPASSAADDEALRLVQEAERLEATGQNMEAMALYRKAFKLSPSVAKSFGN